MRPFAAVQKAYDVDDRATLVALLGLLFTCAALVGGDWLGALVMLAISAAFGSIAWEGLAPDSNRVARWSRVAKIAATLVVLAVACVRAFDGHFFLVAGPGLAIVLGYGIVLGPRAHVRCPGNSDR